MTMHFFCIAYYADFASNKWKEEKKESRTNESKNERKVAKLFGLILGCCKSAYYANETELIVDKRIATSANQSIKLNINKLDEQLFGLICNLGASGH